VARALGRRSSAWLVGPMVVVGEMAVGDNLMGMVGGRGRLGISVLKVTHVGAMRRRGRHRSWTVEDGSGRVTSWLGHYGRASVADAKDGADVRLAARVGGGIGEELTGTRWQAGASGGRR
jgi:hypothetical protein